jgi:hypothetical protein
MKTHLLNNRDVLAGTLFVAIGACGLYAAMAYPFGSLQDMGPGFFPRALGVILMGFGVVTAIRGWISGHPVEGRWGWWPLLMLSLSLLAFGWLMEHLGLIPAMLVLVVTSAMAGKEFRWSEVAVLAVVLCLLALAIFVWGLGLPYELFKLDLGG